MTAMDTQVESIPPLAPGPPAPPPQPGSSGGVQLPHWRSEPLPPHLAPTKEEIEKEQYANLPDKLLKTLNRDKKPFTYTPQGVSGVEKGKLDLSNIRSPRMKKRLIANLADDEEESDSERVTRSETPDLITKPKPLQNTRRATTPDVITYNNKQIYAPVLPKEPVFPEERHSPFIYRHEPQQQREEIRNVIPQEEFESFLNRQMEEMENFVKPKQEITSQVPIREANPPLAEEEDFEESEERVVPIKVESTQEEVKPKPKPDYDSLSTKIVESVVKQLGMEIDSINNNLPQQPNIQNNQQTIGINGKNVDNISDRYSSDGNRNRTERNPWESDILKHVLDGGLQEEIEKFEKVSLETQESLNQSRARSSQINDYSDKLGPKLYGETYYEPYSHQQADTWSPPNYIQNPYIQPQSPYGSLNRKQQSKSPQPPKSTPWSGQQRAWSETPSPSPQSYFEHNSATTDYSYRGGNIPSKSFQYNKLRTGINDSEVPNYNSRPKPFYLCSPPPTPTATPPPQFLSQQQQKQPQSKIFGTKISPQKISYQTDLYNSAIAQTPQTRYIESSQMYSQTAYTDKQCDNPGIRSPDPYRDSGVRTPEPQVNPGRNIKKKLPPSEQPPDPTPSKYMGANIPSRSFRFLQLMTGEDIENQFSAQNANQNVYKRNISPNAGYKVTNSGLNNSPRSGGYSSNLDSGTDF